MESEVFGAANVVGCEALATTPSLLNHTIQDVTHRLVDGIMCELEKGESICSLQTVEQNQFSDLQSVEIRRTVKITKLVRCGECTFSDWYVTNNRKLFCYCVKHCSSGHTKDDFCSYGKREVQE